MQMDTPLSQCHAMSMKRSSDSLKMFFLKRFEIYKFYHAGGGYTKI